MSGEDGLRKATKGYIVVGVGVGLGALALAGYGLEAPSAFGAIVVVAGSVWLAKELGLTHTADREIDQELDVLRRLTEPDSEMRKRAELERVLRKRHPQ
jgi:hypothetical protein